MSCKKARPLTEYRAQFVDLRQFRPRTVHSEIHVFDDRFLQALADLRKSPEEYIQELHGAAGQLAFRVERINYESEVSCHEM